ncbi:MAG: hypothetical protein ACRENP_13440 [Longimicrobiales bacterium]
MTSIRYGVWLAAVLVAPAVVRAQDTVTIRGITVGPPIQRIATASALSTEQIGSITSVRELADGRVLVNDGTRRRLLIMDTTLKTVEVVLDSLSEIANTYGTRAGALIPFRGDTTLFVDPVSYAIVVLDPLGKITRVRSVWRVQDVPWFTQTGFYGWPGVDGKGRIVYRIPAQAPRPMVMPPSGIPYIPQEPDSSFIVAVNLDTRRLDTLGAIRIPKTEMRVRRSVEGRLSIESVMNPLPTTDDWAVLSDQRVAFVRWRDYRIDYLNVDGTWTSSAKLPYDWQRMTDDDKQRMVDSVKTTMQRSAQTQYISAMIRWVNMYGKSYPENFTVPEGFVLPPGMAKDWTLPKGVSFPATYIYACAPGVEPTPPGPPTTTGGAAPPGAPRAPSCLPAPIIMSGGVTPPPPTVRQINVMPAAELPDYRPPLPQGGAVRADADGNLWIRTVPARPTPGGLVYDIISPQGELVNRLQTPPGYTLVGFGKGKIVYLSMRDASGIHLARVRLK